ncbi:malate Na(+) symporter [Klebsiella pneumoniae subsp. ozaenae]|uniref:Malate Na(+) symporter n=1 Tax=Klebsiella pneumoniae subsp. ozaenae TaxID=574 RepID=A0A378C3P4_KLEPO|nr:malate Na(+) symporter [Klebsiella pneumoniae subsp. ozaenae]
MVNASRCWGNSVAAAICATFIPSALVHYGLLPDVVIESTTKFYKSTNILYLYICCIIVGSIMSMNRTTLIQGFLKIFFPMLCGEVVGMLVGIGVGTLLAWSRSRCSSLSCCRLWPAAWGEGAIPLSMGYAALMHMEQGVALGRVLPMVMLGSLTAIVISGCLNQLGKRFPHLTGEGQLMPNRSHETRSLSESEGVSGKTDVGTLASGALLAVLLYMMGMLGHKLIGLPAPVGMLFLAVLLKLANVVSPRLQEGSQMVYKFFRTAVTYPILFAVGVAITPWQETGKRLHFNQLLVIVSTVSRAGGDRFPGWVKR